MADKRLTAKRKWAEIQAQYQASEKRYLHGLVVGRKGVGKTSLLKTCPRPILVYSFDPGGTDLAELEPLKQSGEMIVRKYEKDDLANPTAYKNFERDFNQDERDGLFDIVGTIALDSITELATAMEWQIMAKEGRQPANMLSKTGGDQGMRIQDWGTLLRAFLLWGRRLSSIPAHTLIMGHIALHKDEVFGGMVKSLLLPGQAAEKVPVIIPEVYYLLTKEDGKRYLLTDIQRGYQASTKIGGLRNGKRLFEAEEKPDIRYLLKKAGLPFEDITINEEEPSNEQGLTKQEKSTTEI